VGRGWKRGWRGGVGKGLDWRVGKGVTGAGKELVGRGRNGLAGGRKFEGEWWINLWIK